ncbi:hypothetical protein [Stratiformator vulcanicus]|uniref:Preprotein translocase subunit SecD n=1 Tax=Stratiformator vulcanicus TaxID=2527980 RepID=A0A517R218_9PLAN|nr:hypothetical protein [Stratiformator vulcanicus]QDT37929.1 hypothetical protein Pan189_23120 [Stratiformator vulcanicus]
MRFACLCFATALFCLTSIGVAGDEIALPDDPKATVIVLDFTGGYGLPPKGPPIQDLVIHADGSVEFDDRTGGPALKAEIEKKELQELLTFIVNEKKFFDIDAAELEAEKKKSGGLGLFVSDAATVTVEVTTADDKNAVKLYAPSMLARQYPKIEGYQNFDAVRLKLLKVYSRLRAEHKEKE